MARRAKHDGLALGYVRDHGPCTATEVGRAVKRRHRTENVASSVGLEICRRLVREGELRRRTDGLYDLASDGSLEAYFERWSRCAG